MPHTILAIKNAVVKIAPTRGTPVFVDFSDAIDQIKAQITSEDYQWLPVSGNPQNQTGALKWEVALNLGQDTKTGGLLHFLITNHGALGKMEFYPKGGTTTPKFVGDVILKAPDGLGGAVGVATAAVVLRVDNAPVITWEP